MIRPVATSEDGHTVYGLTIRGVAVLGAALGVLVGALAFSVLAFVHSEEATRNRILASCQESNRRHTEAIPLVIGLAKIPQPASSSAERAATAEAVKVLEARLLGRPPPKLSAEGKVFLGRLDDFTQVIAPAYDCRTRLARFTKS